jgi:hypothetical protein
VDMCIELAGVMKAKGPLRDRSRPTIRAERTAASVPRLPMSRHSPSANPGHWRNVRFTRSRAGSRRSQNDPTQPFAASPMNDRKNGAAPSGRGNRARSRRRAAVLNVRRTFHVPERNNFARTQRPPISFDAVAPMHRIRPALSPRFEPPP